MNLDDGVIVIKTTVPFLCWLFMNWSSWLEVIHPIYLKWLFTLKFMQYHYFAMWELGGQLISCHIANSSFYECLVDFVHWYDWIEVYFEVREVDTFANANKKSMFFLFFFPDIMNALILVKARIYSRYTKLKKKNHEYST